MQQSRSSLGKKLTLGFISLIALSVLLEVGARTYLTWFMSDQDFRNYASFAQLEARYGEYSRFQAHRHLGFSLTPGYQSGDNRHNSSGFRGEEFDREAMAKGLRIAFVGGSTTYGEGVSGQYFLSYPWFLQEKLRAVGVDTHVINAGTPGWTTLETLINFQSRVLEYEPQYLVVCHGINSVFPRMVWPEEAYVGDLSGWLSRTEHDSQGSWMESSTFLRMVLVNSGGMEPHGSLQRIVGDVPPSSHYLNFRHQRNAGTYPDGVFGSVPVEQMLEANPPVYFERNLRSLVASAQAHGVKVVLTTFAFSRLFPARAYVGYPAVQESIEGTNAIVRQIASELSIDLVDLAELIEDQESLFTDGVHFTSEGNHRRSDILLEYFREELGK